MAAILDQGKQAIRDSLKTLVTHVGVAVDSTAFSAAQTVLDPAGDVSADRLIKASSEANVDGNTFDATITIDGTTELTNKSIHTIALMNGSTRTAALSRTVRQAAGPDLGIGVIAGDSHTVGIRVQVQDNS